MIYTHSNLLVEKNDHKHCKQNIVISMIGQSLKLQLCIIIIKITIIYFISSEITMVALYIDDCDMFDSLLL
jgi:hypothetical protein